MQTTSLLALAGGDVHTNDFLGSEPLVPYTEDERRLSAHVEREIDRLILGHRDNLVLLKMYPRRAGGPVTDAGWLGLDGREVRPEIAARIAAGALSFFGPLRGGVVAQDVQDDVIVQVRRFATPFPHITLQRYDVYDTPTRDPLLGAWQACRIQNLRRETRTNRVIDVALLALEVGKSVFPKLLA